MSEVLYKSFDFYGDSFDVFEALSQEPYVFFLDSSAYPHKTLGRFSFIGFDPFHIFSGGGPKALTDLRKDFYQIAKEFKTPFTPLPAGLIGFLSYDIGLYGENIKQQKKENLPIPEAVFGFYDTVLTIDHVKHKLYVVSTGLPEKKDHLRKKRSRERLEDVIRRFSYSFSLKRRQPATASFKKPHRALALKSNFTKENYYRAIKKILHYIREGDVYQVNLSQRFAFRPWQNFNPVEIYRSLRHRSPSYFTSYFDGGDFQVISSSPERFLQVHQNLVQTRPMKGTRPRGHDGGSDKRQKENLVKSDKDKAELLMVTDLERNDLGRVCEFGSIKVKQLRTIESYRTVFQATSTIEGRLRREKDAFDVLRACFPGGSITGCPKIRAMQIIEELEPHHRGIYTGILGYISSGGNADFNILIRTMLAHQNKIYFHVGGGIVADSTPEGEYQETLIKARALCESLEEVGGNLSFQ